MTGKNEVTARQLRGEPGELDRLTRRSADGAQRKLPFDASFFGCCPRSCRPHRQPKCVPWAALVAYLTGALQTARLARSKVRAVASAATTADGVRRRHKRLRLAAPFEPHHVASVRSPRPSRGSFSEGPKGVASCREIGRRRRPL